MSEKIKISAPGKVILHGEYAVVYHKKAIAVSVGLFTSLELEPLGSQEVNFQFPVINLDCTLSFDTIRQLQASLGSEYRFSKMDSQRPINLNPESVKLIQEFVHGMNLIPPSKGSAGAQLKAAEAFLGLYLAIFEEPAPWRFQIETDLPVGAGLGSSASFATSLATGMLLATKRISKDFNKEDLDMVNRWAYFSEKFVHGTPSGIDNHVTTYGGGIVFQRGQGGQEQTAENIPCLDIRALLVDTTVSRSTSALIQKTSKLKEESLETWQKIMDDIGTLVESALEGIRKSSLNPALIQENHKILQKLGVSHPALDKIVELAQKHGFSGKLTGAGGGGCAFIYIPSNTQDGVLNGLKASLKDAGFTFWDTKLGSQGVHLV